MLLPHVPDLAISKIRKLTLGEINNISIFVVYRPGTGLVEAADEVKQRAFPGPALTDDGDLLALGHPQRQVVKNHQILVAGTVYLREIFDAKRFRMQVCCQGQATVYRQGRNAVGSKDLNGMQLAQWRGCGKLESVTVELKPETERLVQEEIRRGHFHSVDEVIVQGVYALREKSNISQDTGAPPRPRKKLYDLLTQSPFAGSELNLERRKDYPRPVDL